MVEAVQLKSEPVNHRRLTKFTPERIQQILNLVERGISPDEIAEIIGVTIGRCKSTALRWASA
jgi:DNA-directed RNA polymerase specialized sigma24 family protein